MKIKVLIFYVVIFLTLWSCQSENKLSYTVKLDTIIKHWDGVFNWTQARVGSIPGKGETGNPLLVVTMQKWFVEHSDYYSGLFVMSSKNMGETWTAPKERPELGWHEKDNGKIIEGICDFVPGWHQQTGKLLAIGHTVYYYKGGQLINERPRSTAYAVYDPDSDKWTPWKKLEMPDENKFYNSGSGCAQWLVKPDGTLLIPAYFKGKEDTTNCYSSTVLHCSFDGENLTYIEHSNELKLDVPRGCYEPSLTFYKGKYYLTLRNDVKAYVTVSGDAMKWESIKPWTFDNGKEIGSYNTQQHWVTHSDGLFLVYTRKGANNDHIPRSRAPLFIASVDTDALCLIKSSERILIPERGAMMGNFGVTTINEKETWVTVGENMYPKENLNRGADGSVFAARILWSKSNKIYQQ